MNLELEASLGCLPRAQACTALAFTFIAVLDINGPQNGLSNGSNVSYDTELHASATLPGLQSLFKDALVGKA